ncbi:MAG: hypothetical protein Q8O53_00430, partial [Candidatus Moranbacteria bacterium]|nr:hypothetical protein [Candidatus Moranbacteria bacterium]
MKISVICKTKEWQVERLKEEAEKLSIDFEVHDIVSADVLPKNLGEIVLWRSSSLGGGENRQHVMQTITADHILINRCLAKLPRATEKEFQQAYVREKTTTINCITTFRFSSKEAVNKALQEKTLRFPFIAKPNKGSKGQGVALIHTIDDLDHTENPLEELVFQNFIQNSGDYRIFVLGGRVLGVIKRTAQEGGFLNNISQGGSAEMITDQKILSTLRRIGTTVASIFELTICGVDVIYDEIEKKFFFLEVNTVPQWKGFQTATNINVAKEIILFCKRLADRKTTSVPALVREEYDSQIHLLGNKQFHFLSRLFLWTGADTYKTLLGDFKKNYIGTSEADYEAVLQKVYTTLPEHGPRMAGRETRMPYFTKYPELEPFLNLLFKNLFAQKLYGVDLHPLIKKLVTNDQLLTLKKNLEQDREALQILSTHAINYLYLLESYLDTEEKKADPAHYLEVGSSYPENSFELQIYFFTHC